MNNLINKILFSSVFMSLLCISINAQINGIVKDEYGRILQGVIITSENGKNITTTDRTGRYNIIILKFPTYYYQYLREGTRL
ncbi:MAG: carboxypeptidase-like regulatory domain-containing protein [Tannerella sp.]|jgi:hypothetical protein|nr:carboxypeptidase-like regulatory domain-containing protein [Tannerella sp.]